MIYLDFNRTTPVAPSALEAMQPFWSTHFMLPGQEHPHARAVSEAIDAAREGVARMAGCDPFELVFTSGGTEANNLAILGITQGPSQVRDGPGHLLVSSLEHESVLSAAESLTRGGWDVEYVSPGPSGIVEADRFAERIRPQTRLACLQLASPALGTIQPVRELADLCHGRGVAVHCDAVAAFGKMTVDLHALRVDTAAISSHKVYGPKGTGAVYVRRGLPLAPIGFGESGEMGLRPGCENVPAWVGFGAAASLASRSCDIVDTLARLRTSLIDGLRASVRPAPLVLCESSPRLANTVALEMPVEARRIRRWARQIAMATAQSGAPPDELTRALRAIGRSEAQIGRTIRLSVGWTTSQDQVDHAVDLLAEAADGGR